MRTTLDEGAGTALNTKVCPFCKEAIHEGARKCPRCQQWQGWARLFSYAPAAIFILLFLFVQQRMETMTEGRLNSFESHRSEVRVANSSTHYGGDTSCPSVSTVVQIQNDSELAWKDPVLEVRYFDKDGQLIDAYTNREYMVLAPRSETAVVLRSRPVRPEADYVSHQVKITGARDARSLF